MFEREMIGKVENSLEERTVLYKVLRAKMDLIYSEKAKRKMHFTPKK